MSKCNGHIQGEPGHEQVFFCPECLYVELQAENDRLKEIIGNVDALIAKGIIFTVDDVKRALKG